MITQEDANKIVDILRNIGDQLIVNDSLRKSIFAAAFTSFFMTRFKGILPDGVTLPEDAEKLVSLGHDDETVKMILSMF